MTRQEQIAWAAGIFEGEGSCACANARNFLATIYPLLSVRRKAQVARIGVFEYAGEGIS